MSVAETMKAITDCAKKLIEAPRYNVGDFVGVYGYETDVRIHDIRWEGSCFTYKVYLADEETWLYDDDIAYKKDEMIEGLAEELLDNDMEEHQKIVDEIMAIQGIEPIEAEIEEVWHCPDGYIFKDKNGNVINATKIVLEKKKKEYPKTYDECLNELDIHEAVAICGWEKEIKVLQTLLVCRDAYWKIAGEEMGLGKPWEPDYTNTNEKKFSIWVDFGEIKLGGPFTTTQMVLSFPTAEMRDAFYENFKGLIESIKELL